jgi:hypothetical protein
MHQDCKKINSWYSTRTDVRWRQVTVLEVSDFQLHLLPMTRGIRWSHSPSVQGKAKDWSNLLDGTCHCCRQGVWMWKNLKKCEDQQESSRIRVSESQKGWSLSSCQIPVWAKSPSEWSELGLACAEMLRLRPLRTTFRPFPPVLTESQFEHPRYLVLSSCKLASHASACSDTMDSRFDTHDSHKVHMSYSHTVCYSVLYCTRVFTTLVLECTTMCCDMLCTFICFAVPI